MESYEHMNMFERSNIVTVHERISNVSEAGSMYQKVKAYMKEHGMVVIGDVVLAGVSGGGDSMAMLDMLRKISGRKFLFRCARYMYIMESAARRLTGMKE